jgi:hypothetical protein
LCNSDEPRTDSLAASCRYLSSVACRFSNHPRAIKFAITSSAISKAALLRTRQAGFDQFVSMEDAQLEAKSFRQIAAMQFVST